jgi:hypothetical protein
MLGAFQFLRRDQALHWLRGALLSCGQQEAMDRMQARTLRLPVMGDNLGALMLAPAYGARLNKLHSLY